MYDVGEDWLRVRCTPQGEYFYGTLVQDAAAAQWQSMDGNQHRSVERPRRYPWSAGCRNWTL